MDREQGDEDNKDAVEHPCIRHCCLDDNDVCLGCFRTLDEILNWSMSSNQEKQAILAQCQLRKKAHARRL